MTTTGCLKTEPVKLIKSKSAITVLFFFFTDKYFAWFNGKNWTNFHLRPLDRLRVVFPVAPPHSPGIEVQPLRFEEWQFVYHQVPLLDRAQLTEEPSLSRSLVENAEPR